MDSLSQNTPQKQCSNPDCRQWLPATTEYFHRDKKGKYGLAGYCKACACKKSQSHHYAHQEAANAKRRLYHADHREAENARNRAYLAAHSEEAADRVMAWRQANPERVRANKRVAFHTRKARKKAVPGTYTPEQIADQLKRQNYRCYYAACGHAKFKRIKENGAWKYLYEVDHTFPISRVVGTDIPANDISYLVLACPACNNSKNSKFPWEWPEGGRLL